MNYSRHREAILKVVQSAQRHPTADWIYDQVRKDLPTISLATVYRNLNQLVDAGQIIAVQDGRQVRYDRNLNKHDHFICQQCGTLYDIEIESRELVEAVNRAYDFKINDVNIELTGICSACNR